jgi:Domain of unknown function (DUF4625)
MNHYKNYFFLIPVFLLLAFLGCKKKDNSEPFTEIMEPRNQDLFFSGSSFNVEAKYWDDIELLQYSIISNIEEPGIYNKKQVITQPYYFNQNYGLSGVESTKTDQIKIPVDIATGTYILEVFCVDFTGKISDSQFVKYRIQNVKDQKPPVLTINNLDENRVDTFKVSKPIQISGSAFDDQNLGAVFVSMYNPFDETFEYIQRFDLGGNVDSINVAATALSIPGNYSLIISLADNVNNRDTKEYRINVR